MVSDIALAFRGSGRSVGSRFLRMAQESGLWDEENPKRVRRLVAKFVASESSGLAEKCVKIRRLANNLAVRVDTLRANAPIDIDRAKAAERARCARIVMQLWDEHRNSDAKASDLFGVLHMRIQDPNHHAP